MFFLANAMLFQLMKFLSVTSYSSCSLNIILKAYFCFLKAETFLVRSSDLFPASLAKNKQMQS